GAYCNINPGCHISGYVKLGDGVDFGTGAVIIHGKSVGDWSIIGAGAVVAEDIPSKVTAVGVPCRVIKNHQLESSIAAGSCGLFLENLMEKEGSRTRLYDFLRV